MSWFPGFNGTMSRSDCSLPIPSSSVSSALGTFCPDALVRSEHPPIGWLMLGLARISAEPHAVFAKEARALPGSWAALMHVPRSTTPVEHLSPTTRPKYVAFRPLKDVGSHDEQHFGAQSRGPYTPCVRFTLTVTRHGATLGSGWWSALARWGFHPWGCERGFNVYSIFLLSRLCLAHSG